MKNSVAIALYILGAAIMGPVGLAIVYVALHFAKKISNGAAKE